MRYNKATKIVSMALVAAFAASTVGSVVFAAEANNGSRTAQVVDAMSSIINGDRAVGKEETVYVLADANGAVKKVIVSEWLKNTNGSQKLNDKTELENITDVKGEKTYTIDKDNMRIWDAEGNDIYYQGETDKSLPVDISISYKLDGAAVSAEELAGKSGKVTMRFDYTNNQKQTVKIDGKNEDIYVPFVMVTGMILDNSNFKNVSISNGKLINDGDRCVAMGFALPGLQENLGIAKTDLEMPSYVEITADVTDFSLTTTMTVATNDIFNSLNLDGIDSLDNLDSALGELEDASNKLVDGSSALYAGISTLLDKSGELINGINQLYDGAELLMDGSTTLSEGATELDKGAAQLYAGLKKLDSNSDSLNAGAKQVFETLLSAADEQLAAAGLKVKKLTISNYSETLKAVLNSLDKDTVYQMVYNTAKTKVTEKVEESRPTVKAAVEAAVKKQVLEAVLSSAGLSMTADQYEAAVAAGQIDGGTKASISAAVDSQMESEAIKEKVKSATNKKIDELIDENMQSDEVKAQINAAVKQAASGSNSINALLSQLDSYNTFYKGLTSYTDGVGSACSGSKSLAYGSGKLKDGGEALSAGISDLLNGIGVLRTGADALADGVNQLKDGAMQLSDGMKEFDKQGIKKLVNAYNGDVKELITRMKATVDVSKNYQSFAGIADETQGSVKFIYRTDSIGK